MSCAVYITLLFGLVLVIRCFAFVLRGMGGQRIVHLILTHRLNLEATMSSKGGQKSDQCKDPCKPVVQCQDPCPDPCVPPPQCKDPCPPDPCQQQGQQGQHGGHHGGHHGGGGTKK
ncbi:Hypothetical predicted protein [Pelobates cultripes]|uniref:Uncharacterized protein n=1 Tax=Pelobates cultripes TaxID=61616 RepID=A0AAD1T7Z4_PELCU|nr:Hypothetical predicted protein [Pelobates cultripes]